MGLDQVLAILRKHPLSAQAPYLVVLNHQAQPQGLLPGLQLLLLTIDPVKSISDRQLADFDSLVLESLPTLPGAMTVLQFRSYLNQLLLPPPVAWALIDKTGAYLGLLDMVALSRQLILAAPMSLPDIPFAASRLSPAILDWIAQIIDPLPMPLMLQTSSGKILLQNVAWQQIGQLLDAQPGLTANASLQPELDIESLVSCYGGNGSDALVCRCLTPDQQERWWSFTRVLLAPVASDQLKELDAVSAGKSPISQPTELSTRAIANSLSVALETAWKSQAASAALWLVIASDITDQKTDQNLVRVDQSQHQNVAGGLAAQNHYLLQQQRLKDEVLAAIAHDLKSPLTAILGLSAVLQDDRLGVLSERQQAYINLIHHSGQRLLNLVNDLLDLGLMERQQLELTISTQEMRPLCQRAYEEAVQAYRFNLGLADLPLHQDPPGLELQISPEMELVMADGLRLRQMLVYLLTNAISITPTGGTLGLKLEHWSSWLTFTVWDTGAGLSISQQYGLFYQFQPPENAGTRRFQDNGLGLILTRRLAHCHGGDVSFISQENQGSEFTLLLPDRSTANRPPENRLILLADATTRLQEELRVTLLAQNYQVVIARSGVEALEKARQLKPWLIFLNPFLPLLSGEDVVSLLKQDPTTTQSPIILITAPASPPLLDQTQADGYLSLPVQLSQLQHLLNTWEHRRQQTHCSQALIPKDQLDTQFVSVEENIPYMLELTVLRLGSKTALQLEYCRVLEADDLEQADLLARIWQPQVLLWDYPTPHPLPYLQQLHQYDSLVSLPLVILNAEAARSAHQVLGLEVFPCLVAEQPTPEQVAQDARTLWQVLSVAAGL